MSDLIAYKSNVLIEASYKLTLQEQRFLLVCIGKLNPQDEEPRKTIEITANEFFLAFPDMGMENSERRLQDAIDRLWDRTITLKDDKEKEDFRWIQRKAKYFSGEGKVSVTFSDSVMPYLTQLKGQFTKVVIKNVSALSKTHSIRIYELLQQFKKTGDRLIRVDDFRSMLGLEDKYSEFKILNRALLKPALKELNEKSDLTVTFDTVKKGRTVIALHFHFKEDKQIKIAL